MRSPRYRLPAHPKRREGRQKGRSAIIMKAISMKPTLAASWRCQMLEQTFRSLRFVQRAPVFALVAALPMALAVHSAAHVSRPAHGASRTGKSARLTYAG